MKLRIKGNVGLFDATVLLDDPDCQEMGHQAMIRISGADGDEIFAAPAVAAHRCEPVWATAEEWHCLSMYGFLPAEQDEQAS